MKRTMKRKLKKVRRIKNVITTEQKTNISNSIETDVTEQIVAESDPTEEKTMNIAGRSDTGKNNILDHFCNVVFVMLWLRYYGGHVIFITLHEIIYAV